MILTKHAEQRCQERLINSKQVDWLLCYGEESHNRGVCLFHFDRDSYLQLLKDVDSNDLDLALHSRNIYAVITEEVVITAGYRDARLKPTKSHKRIRRGVPIHAAERRLLNRKR